MWAAMKADMSEFVSTVKADASDTLNALDSNLDDVNDEFNDADVPLIDADTGIVIEDNYITTTTATTTTTTTTDVAAPEDVEEMVEYLHSCQAVFCDPLLEEEIMEPAFHIDDKTQEISQLLEKYPNTLQATFAQLTSEVEYAEFWKRYFYRLHEARLEETYAAYYHQEEDTRGSALTSVANFLGGAVSRLVDEGDEDDDYEEEEVEEPVAPSPFYNKTGEASARSALDFLTGGGRPPFVLNTALSDDDDEYDSKEQQQEEEEEEELGWGEDTDDEDEDVVEFKDKEKEMFQDKLQQAADERDQLQNTIEMQAEEIKKLKEQSGASTGDQVEALNVQLFEKESELAALRAKLEDDETETQQEQQQLYDEKLHAQLSQKEQTIQDLQAELVTVKSNDSKASQSALKQTKLENQELMIALTDVKQRWQQQGGNNHEAEQALEQATAENQELNTEVVSLRQKLEALQNDFNVATESSAQGDELEGQLLQAKQEASVLQQEAAQAKSQATALQTENQKVSTELEASRAKTAELTANLEQAKALLQEAAQAASQAEGLGQEKESFIEELQSLKSNYASLENELQTSKTLLQQTQAELEIRTHSSAKSHSTGVKVDSTGSETPVVSKRDSAGGEGEDWGDDW
jgi:hypothetical protein